MSRLPFELFLALRYLRPKRTFVSVITLISVLGVLLGVWVLIVVISVMSGFDRQLRERLVGFSAHLRVVQRESGIMTNYPAVMKQLAANPHVRGIAPYVLGRVMVQTQPEQGNPQVNAPYLRGIDPRYETNVSSLHTNLLAGSFDLEGRSSVLVGAELARTLQLRIGDRLAVYSPRHLDEWRKNKGKNLEEVAPPDDFTVTGIFDAGYHEFDRDFIITSLENAQDLYRINNAVHGLWVMVDDPFKVAEVREQLLPLLGLDYGVVLWTEDYSALLDAIMVEKKVMFVVLFFVVIVAAFGIVNSQITFVMQKTREIGVLKAVGAARRQILWLFLSQSLIVGVIGVLSGYGLGILTLAYRNEFLHFLREWTGIEIFPASIYGFSELPALIEPMDIALICGSALVSCVAAGLLPALKAALKHPVEALRYE